MDDKINRFLNSINLNPTDFDLSFDAIYRDKINNNLWVMLLVKQTPWTYENLASFLYALKYITYEYKIVFSYVKRPTSTDALNLFYEWYIDNNHNSFANAKIVVNPSDLTFIYQSTAEHDRDKFALTDFRSFLEFINYDFSIVTQIEETANNDEFNSLTSLDHDAIIQEEKIKHDLEVKNAENYELKNYELERKTSFLANEKKKLNKLVEEYEHYDNFNLINKERVQYVEVEGEFFSPTVYTNPRLDKISLNGYLGRDSSAIAVKITENSKHLLRENLLDINKQINENNQKVFLRIRGASHIDDRTRELIVIAHYIETLPPPKLRDDNAPIKRVELHLHTNLSASDGVNDIKDYVTLADHMGHKALAITDHGVIQAFPYAHLAAKKTNLKILYGVEFYMVDRKLNYIFNPSDINLRGASYVCLDLETTGLSARYDRVIEFGAVKLKNELISSRLDILINPECEIAEHTTRLTHISNDMVKDKKTFKEVWPTIKEFIGDSIIVTHNTVFDISFLNGELERMGLDVIRNPVIDTLSLSRSMFADSVAHNLGSLSRRLELNVYDDDKAHRADFDADVLARVWSVILNRLLLKNRDYKHFQLGEIEAPKETFRHLRGTHTVVLAKNAKGLKDLYKLITLSHLDYFADVPKIPRDEIEKYRENLLIGSACFNGEIFELAHTRTRKVLKKAMQFYDYIEIQPLCCYEPLMYRYKFSKTEYESGDKDRAIRHAYLMPELKSYEEIKRTICDIIDVADELEKPVCATGDVHYCDPSDKVGRDIYIATDGLNHRPHPLCNNPRGQVVDDIHLDSPNQHFRTTEEMLNEFKFLGEERANEIVITNTNKIADLCEKVSPVKDRLYTPNIENADQILRDSAYKKAHELFGEELPELIVKRIEKEMSRIIGEKESYSVNYLLARDIVDKANKDGFFVGSRGSVGSSYVATLLGVTEVNPLPPHYYCPKCKKIIFVDSNEYPSGSDLPPKECETCKTIMYGDGQNIPFETFLGFDEKSTKVPDIDLNFADVYQPRAHDFLREKFGRHHVFRAGTITAYQDKMAYGCAKDYAIRTLRLKEDEIPKAYLSYLAHKCSGVKRSTGQHPGGIILIPKEFDVHDFTPIQHPADNEDADWETTHFEYKTIHDTVLKLDLLGHVDPLALKYMGELTNVDFTKLPLGDIRVLSLFTSPKELRLKNNSLHWKTGTLGMPEFGTSFVQNVLEETKPTTFNDLLVVSGITHGTNIWVGNAEDLLKNNADMSLKDIIGCRDDIMIYLMSKGVAYDASFKIMEDVRKGRGLKPEYVTAMKEKGVPDYYIESCNKIKYLFPRAHAAAYVTQAVRVGYFKVYYPLEFYAVYFSLRCKKYDLQSMIGGYNVIKQKLESLSNRRKSGDKLSVKENEIYDTLLMALEMTDRGFTFLNIDINKSDSTNFVIDKDKKGLIPPFIVLDGLGESVANDIVKGRNDKAYSSIEDFTSRSHTPRTQMQVMKKIGVFDGIPESNQPTLFNFI